jgi:Lipase (class 3)
MNREVFLSILAMDSYQRGYAPGISGVTGDGIGNATLLTDSSSQSNYGLTLASTSAVGFFAQAYTWEGQTVISYRGTDFDVGRGTQFVRDFIFGWSTFTGLWKASQFPLAQQFFKAVTGSDFPVGNQAPVANIITTGHSLGGALAGLVAARGKTDSYLVDPIPYGATAWGQAIGDALTATFVYFGKHPDSLAENILELR